MPQFAFLRRGSFFLLMLALSFSALLGVRRSQAVEPGARVIEAYGRLPLGFEENRGQADARVAFLARGEGYGVFLTGAGMRLSLREGALAFTLAGANPRATARGIDPLPGRSHYFRGSDPSRWVTNVAQYARVKVEAVYPGIDLVYYGNQRQLEYDFLVAPGADPGRIEFALNGADGLRLNAEGDLLIEAPGGELIQRRPFVYQEVGGERRQVAGRHRIVDGNRVAFEIGAYDRSLPLVIDPVLVYASVLGGNNGETAYSVAVDAEGNAYLAGETSSTDFPTASTLQPAVLSVDAMILKMNAAGTALVYATWLGGDFNDAARGIAVDGAGNGFVAGSTESLNFPTTPGALARQLPAQSAAFVARLNAQGSALIYSTYFDSAQSIAVDAGGNAFVAGTTSAADFPIANLTNARIGRPLYKTTNAGGNWSAVTGAPPSNQVLAFAIDPKTPTTMYAGTTTGVYKSANGGATWTRPGTGEFAALPSIDIEIDPVDTNIVYSATGGSVLRSNDGGVTWQVKYNGVTNAFQNFDLAIDPKSPKILYVGTEIGVFVTNNGGDGWGPLNNGLSGIGFPNPPRVRKIAIDPVNSSTIYISTSRNVFKTTDSGAIWNPANTGLGGGLSEAPLIAIDPASPQTLYAALLTGLYKSTNGGGNWSAINNGLSAVINGLTTVYRINALAIDPTSPMTLYAGTNGFGVFKSVNGGASWSASNTGLNNRLVSALAIDRTSAATLWAGTNAGADLLVAKLAPAGNALGFFKVLGGYENDFVRGLALDKAGDVYLAGQTSSPNFPALNAFQSALAGSNDGFAMKLSGQDGVILYSTYLGGAGNDEARGVAVDGGGNAVVVGRSTSTNFPLLNPIRPANTAPQLFDAFVTKLNPAGSGLVYSTLLGGASGDEANAVAVDSAGNAYVGGQTSSLDFPAVGATQSALAAGLDGFVTRLNAAGSQILFSTWLGGGSTDQVNSIAVDASRGIYVVGGTSSANFPTQNPLPLPPNRRLPDAFLAKLASSADLAITNEESRDPAMINTELSYTITVTNGGPDLAESATVANPLPAGAGFVAATTTRGSCANASGTVTCTLGDLPTNASATITLTIKTPAAAGTLRSTATATAATSDPDPADNSAAQETRLTDKPSIAGRVTLANGSGLAGATVTLAGAQTATAQTGPTGRYQFAEFPPGSYTVTPAQPGVVFVPASRSYPALAMDQTADFAATSCVLTLTPTNAAIGAQGGPGTIAIAAPNASCPWTARTDASWISFTTPTSGSGSGNLGFSVAPTTVARSAVIEIGGSVFTVRQEVNPCAVPGLAVAPRIFAGRGPTALAAGDFNGDGKPDLATGDNDGMIALLLGDGAGGFAAPATFPVTDAPIGLVAADFDNDGRLDLAGIVSRSAENVFVVFGTGNGRFGEPQKYTAGSAPAVIAATDLNGDNRPELLIANRTPVNLSVLLNQGGGQFGARVSYGNAADPNSIATGDFNGDGRRDVAVAGSAGIDVFYGNNLGAFASITRFTTGSAPRHMVAGDVTGDGRADLLIAVNTLDKGGAIDILKGGEGGFDGSARVPIFTESFASWGALPAPDSLATGDLNNDGKLDLVAVYGHAGIAPLLGNGAAGFATGGLFTSGLFLQHAVVRDFNGDGRADAVASTPGLVSDSAGVLSLFASDAVGGFAAPRAYYAPAGPTRSLLADVNRDGKTDLLALTGTCGNEPCPNDGIVTLRLGDGAGGFGAPATYRVGLDPASFATGDFNGDGRFDLVVGNARSKNLSTLTGAADGGFNPATTTLLPDEPTAMAAGDFNGDNRLDLAVASSPFSSGVYRLYLLLGDGAGGFAAPVSFVSEWPLLSLHAADFNRDGRADLVAATRGCGASSSRIYLFAGRADGTFGEPFRAPEGQGATAMRSADLNGDGRLDLVAVDPCAPEAQAIRVYFGDGAGALAAPMSYPLTPGGAPDPPARELLLADLNSDGRLDAVLNNRTFDSVEMLLGTPAGGFGAPTLFPSGSSTTSIAVGDLNGDGRPDVVAGNRLSSTQTVLLNACRASGSAATVSAASYANPPLASEQIAALFGLNLATSTQLGSTVPLPTSLAGTTVRVRDSAGVDRLAPLFFVSTGQINYLVPPAVAAGPATITITNGAGAASALATQFAPVAPGLFTANANGQGVAAAVALRVKASGAQTFESIATFDATANRFVPLPIDLGPEGDQVYLLLYGTGLRNRRDLSTVTVRIGGFAPSLLYAGPQGDLVGLDQVNLLLPRSLAGRGLVDITLSTDQKNANVVQIQVK